MRRYLWKIMESKALTNGVWLYVLQFFNMVVPLLTIPYITRILGSKSYGIFSIALVALSWINWTAFYRRQYEKVMAEDIEQHANNKYSIHVRYYNAIKDYNDIELQKDIDKFNDEYTAKWLRWVEKRTGYSVEEIKKLPYKGFKYKFIMWRIKHHKYPQSGYTTSMELMSLFAFQEANLNKRDLRADRRYYTWHALQKFVTTLMTVVVGASIIPEMISGEWWTAILKLILGIFSIGMSVIFGALNGIQGARLKLSTVEEACGDLERWAEKKPEKAPYDEIKETPKPEKKEEPKTDPLENIFNLNLPK